MITHIGWHLHGYHRQCRYYVSKSVFGVIVKAWAVKSRAMIPVRIATALPQLLASGSHVAATNICTMLLERQRDLFANFVVVRELFGTASRKNSLVDQLEELTVLEYNTEKLAKPSG